MERPPDSLKSFADRIARLASSGDAAQLNRMLRLSGLLGGAANGIDLERGDMVAAPQNPDHLGIWERRIENGKVCFVRRMETIDEWHFCANLGRIEAKGVKQRIVFLGESVARGYLYDPEFNPALALEKMLAAQLGENEIEVVDLARTNLAYEVRELAISALQLEPDIAIIFAGNNWGVSTPRFADIAEIDDALSKEGMAGAKRISDEQISRHGRRVVRDIATAYEKKGVPLVWIIPEFNLGDWRDPIVNAPYLAEGLNREWLSLLKEAQSALSDGQIDKARRLAQRIIEIDQGICIAGLYLLAECCREQGDIDGQRKYLEMAGDAATWDSFMTIIPRPYSITQEILREEMTKNKNQIVDLPALYNEYLKGEIPDRRMFLDYCHLTSEGIQVAMAGAASCVLRSLKGKEAPWYTLLDNSIAPPPEIEAEASFLAAVHNAHRWQAYDLVRHYCWRALNFSPHVAELMINYIDIQTRPSIPMSMSESQEKMFKLGSPLMHRYLFRFNEQRLDRLLLDAIVDALAEVEIDAREGLDQLRREQHSIAFSETNLLDYYYCSAAQQPHELEGIKWVNLERHLNFNIQYYRAYWPESRFIFVGEAGCALRLCLTCRLPNDKPDEAPISVALNGKPQVEIVIGHEWSSWELELPGEVVRDGLNEVTVHWPVPEFESSAALKKVVQDMCAKKFPEFYPVFGEIHSFTASRGKAVSTTLPAAERELAAVQVS
jgi:hypothetical protein